LVIALLVCFETSAALTGFDSTLATDFFSDFYSTFASAFLLGFAFSTFSTLDLTSGFGSGTMASAFLFDFFSSFLG
jgi:hypothetical protein